MRDDEADAVVEARRRLASNQPRYPAEQIAMRLRALAEAVERDGLNEEQAMALLKRMRAELPAADLLRLEPLPDDDWFFHTMGEVIAENRRREDETGG